MVYQHKWQHFLHQTQVPGTIFKVTPTFIFNCSDNE